MRSLVEMVRQKRPTGPLVSVDEAWKKSIRDRMKTEGISQADLARKIGTTPSAITILFRDETKQSRLVPRIHKALGMVDTSGPVRAVENDDRLKRLLRVWRDLSDAEREHMIATGELLANKT